MGHDYDIVPFDERPEDALERLVQMTNQTSLVALHKTLSAIRRTGPMPAANMAAAAERVRNIAERVTRAAEEVAATLPEKDRTRK